MLRLVSAVSTPACSPRRGGRAGQHRGPVGGQQVAPDTSRRRARSKRATYRAWDPRAATAAGGNGVKPPEFPHTAPLLVVTDGDSDAGSRRPSGRSTSGKRTPPTGWPSASVRGTGTRTPGSALKDGEGGGCRPRRKRRGRGGRPRATPRDQRAQVGLVAQRVERHGDAAVAAQPARRRRRAGSSGAARASRSAAPRAGGRRASVSPARSRWKSVRFATSTRSGSVRGRRRRRR